VIEETSCGLETQASSPLMKVIGSDRRNFCWCEEEERVAWPAF